LTMGQKIAEDQRKHEAGLQDTKLQFTGEEAEKGRQFQGWEAREGRRHATGMQKSTQEHETGLQNTKLSAAESMNISNQGHETGMQESRLKAASKEGEADRSSRKYQVDTMVGEDKRQFDEKLHNERRTTALSYPTTVRDNRMAASTLAVQDNLKSAPPPNPMRAMADDEISPLIKNKSTAPVVEQPAVKSYIANQGLSPLYQDEINAAAATRAAKKKKPSANTTVVPAAPYVGL